MTDTGAHPDTPALVLASASPRRAELLAALGRPFAVDAADVDESVLPDERPADYVRRVARAKADAVASRVPASTVVIAADTTVVLDGAILGKPADADDAARMLRALAGRTHEVMTATVMRHGEVVVDDLTTTRVTFDDLTDADVAAYVTTGEPLDKAGAYGIQGIGGAFVASVDGNVQNVIGLSLVAVRRLLREVGVVLR